MSIKWSEQYRTHHALIDEQHRTLFAQVNKFVRDIRRVKSAVQVERLTTFLRRYVDEHFETEERIMREKRYPLLELQQQQHARFTKDFLYLDTELRSRLATQKTFMRFKIQLLVVDWLANHTMKLDKHFGRFAGRARARQVTQGRQR